MFDHAKSAEEASAGAWCYHWWAPVDWEHTEAHYIQEAVLWSRAWGRCPQDSECADGAAANRQTAETLAGYAKRVADLQKKVDEFDEENRSLDYLRSLAIDFGEEADDKGADELAKIVRAKVNNLKAQAARRRAAQPAANRPAPVPTGSPAKLPPKG